MTDDRDRWDVEVVGLRDPSSAGTAAVAERLAEITALSPAQVQDRLVQPTVAIPVQAGVPHQRARRLASALESAGAVVKLRPSADPAHELVELESDDSFEALGTGPHGNRFGALAESLSRAEASPAALVDLDGGGEPADAPAEQLGGPPPARKPPTPPQPEPRPHGNLELDLERAGLQATPGGLQATDSSPSAPADATPSSGSMVTGSVGTAATSAVRPAPAPSPAPREPRPRLFGHDWATAGLWATAVGLGIGLLPALRVAEGMERDVVRPLEAELAESIERPLAARAGELRQAPAVLEDLDQAHDDLRSRFLLTWLAIGLPLGLGLTVLPRPGSSG